MTKISINGTDVQLPPLTYGAVKANKDTIDKITADGLDYDARVAAAAAFLALAAPAGTDFDLAVPSDILSASKLVYQATFYRPEESAPVPQNP